MKLDGCGRQLGNRPGKTVRNPLATANELPSSSRMSEKYPLTLPFADVRTCRDQVATKGSRTSPSLNRQNAG